ncbi:MAG: sulfatase [Myxococcota bacterium]|nr:sulfatase [Myxococcota bacterium]
MSDETRHIRWPWLAGALISFSLLVGLLLFAWAPGGVSSTRPIGSLEDVESLAEREDLNVLFILLDTLRADRLTPYGYERDTSPHLAALAEEGVRFDRHLAQSSWTKASMASMWTGLYPMRAGITRFDQVIPEDAKLPAERLSEAGFDTVGLYRNGWVSPNFGFGQGFDIYVKPGGRPMAPSVRRDNPTIKGSFSDEDVLYSAMEYLRVNGQGHWFLYLHLMDIHEYTYDEESALFGGDYSDVYDNSIRRVDALLGALFDFLDAQGLSDRTLVVVASDHGEAFRERGFEGHARAVFRESTEVPLLIRFPFRLEPGIVVSSRSRNIDIWPTLLDLLGLEGPSLTDGQSLVDVILAEGRGQSDEQMDSGISHLDTTWGRPDMPSRHAVAVVDGPYRYVRHTAGPSVQESLFDAEEDPLELQDLAEEQPEKLIELRARGVEYLETSPAWGEASTREIGEMELNQLRALGYAIP